jgi:heme-degrading monooxygenase HmoA
MILRRWGARANADGARQYEVHFRDSVLPELARIDGHCGAYLLHRVDGTDIELTVMTLWTSMNAVRAFAGDNPQVAVVEGRAREVLSTFDEVVTHHDVVADTIGYV